MDTTKIQKAIEFLKLAQNGTLTPAEIEKFIQTVLQVIKKSKESFDTLSAENIKVIKDSISYIESKKDIIVDELKKTTESYTKEVLLNLSDIDNKIKDVNSFLKEVKKIKIQKPKDGKPGEDGKNADKEVIIKEVLNQIKLPEYKEVTLDGGEEIVNKINSLPTDDEDLKIQATHIKGLTNFVQKTGGTKNLYQLLDVSITSPTNGQTLVYNSTTQLWENGAGGGGGGVSSLNDLTDAVTISSANSNLTIAEVGNDIRLTVATQVPALTATQVAFGSAGNLMTSNGALAFISASANLIVGRTGLITGIYTLQGATSGSVGITTDATSTQTIFKNSGGNTVLALDFELSSFFSGRVQEKQGASVASGSSLILGKDGNYFHITGTTQINLIRSLGWQAGSVINLYFDAKLTLKHNQTISGNNYPILLNKSVDLETEAGARLTFVLDSTLTAWVQLTPVVVA